MPHSFRKRGLGERRVENFVFSIFFLCSGRAPPQARMRGGAGGVVCLPLESRDPRLPPQSSSRKQTPLIKVNKSAACLKHLNKKFRQEGNKTALGTLAKGMNLIEKIQNLRGDNMSLTFFLC